MPKWLKKESEFFLNDSYGKRYSYANSQENSRVITIIMNVYSDSSVYIEIRYANSEKEHAQAQLERLRNYKIKKSFGENKLYVPKTFDKENLRNVINLIDEFDSLEEIKQEILTITDIIIPAEEIHKKIIDLAQEQQFEQALTLAKKYQADGYQDVVWILAEYLNKNEHSHEAYEAYKAIPDGNPHLIEAAEIIVHMIYSTLDAASKGQITLSEEEILSYREEQFRYALKGGAKLQKHIDQIYHVLCGGAGLTPDIPEVKGDAETLIKLAAKMRNLNTQLAAKETTDMQATSTVHRPFRL